MADPVYPVNKLSAININGVSYIISDQTVQAILEIIPQNNNAISQRINDLNDRLSGIEGTSYENVQSDWDESDSTKETYILNKPDLSNFLTIETNPNWNETNSSSAAYIQNKPTIPELVKSDWNESDSTSYTYILNKPVIPNDSNLVHTMGEEYIYGNKIFTNDIDTNIFIGPELIKMDSIAPQFSNWDWIKVVFKNQTNETLQQALDARNNIRADWNISDSTSYAYILNKPTIPTVPTTSTTVTENDTNPVSGGAVYTKFADLIGTAPDALDTLQEIAYALNNDADLAGTLTTQISAKIPKVSNPTTGNFAYFNSDGTIADSSYNYNTFLKTETPLSKGTTTGAGNAVTDITVNNHEITLTKGTTFLTEHQSLKTINNESLVGTGNIVVSGLPQVSASDNGKILMVVNGQWQLVSPSVLYSGQGVPNNANGNNGDLYMQTE